jgi:hypothetical protein
MPQADKGARGKEGTSCPLLSIQQLRARIALRERLNFWIANNMITQPKEYNTNAWPNLDFGLR